MSLIIPSLELDLILQERAYNKFQLKEIKFSMPILAQSFVKGTFKVLNKI